MLRGRNRRAVRGKAGLEQDSGACAGAQPPEHPAHAFRYNYTPRTVTHRLTAICMPCEIRVYLGQMMENLWHKALMMSAGDI